MLCTLQTTLPKYVRQKKKSISMHSATPAGAVCCFCSTDSSGFPGARTYPFGKITLENFSPLRRNEFNFCVWRILLHFIFHFINFVFANFRIHVCLRKKIDKNAHNHSHRFRYVISICSLFRHFTSSFNRVVALA